MSLLDDGLTS